MRQPGCAKQADQFFQLVLRQVTQLLGMAAANGVMQLAQKSYAFLRDTDANHAPVLRGPVPRNEAAQLQLVK